MSCIYNKLLCTDKKDMKILPAAGKFSRCEVFSTYQQIIWFSHWKNIVWTKLTSCILTPFSCQCSIRKHNHIQVPYCLTSVFLNIIFLCIVSDNIFNSLMRWLTLNIFVIPEVENNFESSLFQNWSVQNKYTLQLMLINLLKLLGQHVINQIFPHLWIIHLRTMTIPITVNLSLTMWN